MQLTALPGVLLLVLLLCCTAAVHAQAEAVDGDEQPTELAARAVFEVGKGLTNGMRYMKWKILSTRIRKGEFGKRITCTILSGSQPPTLTLYNSKGEELGSEDLSGLTATDALAVLDDYGFFPGDTSEPEEGSVEPPRSDNAFAGCGKRKQEPKAAPSAQPAGQQSTAAELAQAAATAAAAAAKAATAAAAAAEAALAALAASNTGTCQG